MEASLSAQELIRPWRRATLVASLIAGFELVGLIACGTLLAHPLSKALRHHAAAQTAAKPVAKTKPVHHAAKVVKHRVAPEPAAKPALKRAQMKVLVLNGNGRNGVAHVEAARLQSLGYRIAGAANAKRHDYATSVVMYKPGFRSEGVRLARDLHVRVVGPLDGLKPSALEGGQLAVILGAR